MLYIKEPPQTESIKEFIDKIVSPHPWENGLFTATYRDPECTDLQCRLARRSFGAICEICKTYFPCCRDRDVAIALAELCFDNSFKFFRCEDINRWVFFKGTAGGFIGYKDYQRTASLSEDIKSLYKITRIKVNGFITGRLYPTLDTKDGTGFAMTDFLSLIENDQQTAGS